MAVMAPLAVLPGSIALLPSRAVQKQQHLSSSSCVFRKSSSGMKIRSLRGVGELRRDRNVRFGVRAAVPGDETGSAAGAGGDSIVSEVAVLAEEPETPGVASTSLSPIATKERKSGALSRGGTLSGKDAFGKDPSKATLGGKDPSKATLGGKVSQAGLFEDPRWVKGNWDLSTFTKDGKVNWDGVIDAEVKRRKWLEDNPEASSNDEPVLFETSTVPWWAWVKRFHLPEAELLNGRAAMVGYFSAYLVDSLTGVGLVDQQSSFLGKLLLFITVVGILIIRKNEDLETIKAVAKESTFYDKQWQASWKEDPTKADKPLE